MIFLIFTYVLFNSPYESFKRGSQPSPWVGPGKPNLPLGLRGKAGGGARVTAGPKRPHLSVCPGQSSLSAGALRYRAWAQSWSSAYPFPHFWPPKDCFTSGRLNRHMPMPFCRLASRSFLLQLLNIMGNGNLREGGRMSVVREQNGLCITLLVPVCVVPTGILWAGGHSLSKQSSCWMHTTEGELSRFAVGMLHM